MGEENKRLTCPKERGWTRKWSFQKKKKKLAVNGDAKKKKKEAGEVNDCKQIRVFECEKVFVRHTRRGRN